MTYIWWLKEIVLIISILIAIFALFKFKTSYFNFFYFCSVGLGVAPDIVWHNSIKLDALTDCLSIILDFPRNLGILGFGVGAIIFGRTARKKITTEKCQLLYERVAVNFALVLGYCWILLFFLSFVFLFASAQHSGDGAGRH